ncbi:Acyl-CoA dehydrogenase [Mycena venus]|uniref:Acyl-CoA dehydrogenase n=1 Tax=Mycena venus TaxID=2733690 RepID=A0A8H6WXJ8_9AGAR|nr:Acyl-CoA dehydrogenase [Mycena venus]
MSTTKQFTAEEVSKHNKEGDLWVIIDSQVFDLSKFAGIHPGGQSVLFDEDPQYARLQIGVIAGEEKQIFPRAIGALSAVPYAEPTWLNPGFHSPYYTENHRRFQTALRKFMEEEIAPDATLREEDGKRASQAVFDAMARTNVLAMRLGPGPHLKGRVLMDGIVKPEEFDYFHELIMAQEGARFHARGYIDGLGGGTYIGLPPIINFGQPAIRDKIVEEVFAGKKLVCLAITEAFAGSDVGDRLEDFCEENRQRMARDGNQGESLAYSMSVSPSVIQKWITNGTMADYFTVGCRSEKGMVVLVIERGPGVETKSIKTSYSPTAGTAYITFDNVLVPFENTLGKDGEGLRVILRYALFPRRHETASDLFPATSTTRGKPSLLINDSLIKTQRRWGMTCNSVAAQRAIVEECMKWASQRKVFGKPLTSQPVIRSKLAAMISRVESAQAWLENVTYQMCHMDYKQQSTHLAGQIAFVKMYATKTAQETAADAVQVFGGRGITRTGMGKHIEHYHRTVPFDSVLGGAEDVLGDLGVRQAMRKMPRNARL